MWLFAQIKHHSEDIAFGSTYAPTGIQMQGRRVCVRIRFGPIKGSREYVMSWSREEATLAPILVP